MSKAEETIFQRQVAVSRNWDGWLVGAQRINPILSHGKKCGGRSEIQWKTSRPLLLNILAVFQTLDHSLLVRPLFFLWFPGNQVSSSDSGHFFLVSLAGSFSLPDLWCWRNLVFSLEVSSSPWLYSLDTLKASQFLSLALSSTSSLSGGLKSPLRR